MQYIPKIYKWEYNVLKFSMDVLVCRRFGWSTFRCVDVSVCRRFGLSTFWFVDVLVCRRFGLSTFWFVDVLVCRSFGCRRFGLSTFWPVTNISQETIPNWYCCQVWPCPTYSSSLCWQGSWWSCQEVDKTLYWAIKQRWFMIYFILLSITFYIKKCVVVV